MRNPSGLLNKAEILASDHRSTQRDDNPQNRRSVSVKVQHLYGNVSSTGLYQMRFVDEVLRTPGAYPGECESTLTVYTMGIRPADEPPGGRPHFPTALLHALARIPQ